MRKKWYRGGRKERRKEKRRSETVPDARDASLRSYLEKAYERTFKGKSLRFPRVRLNWDKKGKVGRD